MWPLRSASVEQTEAPRLVKRDYNTKNIKALTADSLALIAAFSPT